MWRSRSGTSSGSMGSCSPRTGAATLPQVSDPHEPPARAPCSPPLSSSTTSCPAPIPTRIRIPSPIPPRIPSPPRTPPPGDGGAPRCGHRARIRRGGQCRAAHAWRATRSPFPRGKSGTSRRRRRGATESRTPSSRRSTARADDRRDAAPSGDSDDPGARLDSLSCLAVETGPVPAKSTRTPDGSGWTTVESGSRRSAFIWTASASSTRQSHPGTHPPAEVSGAPISRRRRRFQGSGAPLSMSGPPTRTDGARTWMGLQRIICSGAPTKGNGCRIEGSGARTWSSGARMEILAIPRG